MPRTRRTVVAAAVAFGLVAALAGCDAGSTAPSSPPPTPSPPAPIFASDEEALAAAEAAYAAYSETNDRIGSEGGADVERLQDLVGDEIYRESVGFFEKLKGADLVTEGGTRFTGFALAELREEGERAIVAAYFCRDVSEVRIVDAGGVDVTPGDRQLQQSMLGTFASAERRSDLLIVESLTAWSDRPC